jgi:peptidoglycan/LPS O-acetylase OafA/YrhL
MTKIAAVVVLLCAVGAAQAEMWNPANASARAVMQSVSSVQAARLANKVAGMAVVTLPPEDKPKTHWPWWLRILAVIGVLVFIRLVAGSVRNKPMGPPRA